MVAYVLLCTHKMNGTNKLHSLPLKVKQENSKIMKILVDMQNKTCYK